MILLRIGYGYFHEEDVEYFTVERSTATIHLRGKDKPIELFPVKNDDVEVIVKKDEQVHNNIEYILQRTYSIFF